MRKETKPKAFDYAIKDPARDVHVLVGHSFDRPVAYKLSGGPELNNTKNLLKFVAQIPEGAERATNITDLLMMLGSGLIRGISPGFRVPLKDVLPEAEKLITQPGTPCMMIRVLAQLLLYEPSFVTRPAYDTSRAELRSLRNPGTRPMRRIIPP